MQIEVPSIVSASKFEQKATEAPGHQCHRHHLWTKSNDTLLPDAGRHSRQCAGILRFL